MRRSGATMLVVGMAVSACGRLGFEREDLGTWTFVTSSGVVLDPDHTTVSDGGLRLTSIDQLDDDTSSTGFGGGTATAIHWDPGKAMLALDSSVPTARFQSRVFDAGGPVVWGDLAWRSERPSGKPLPDDGRETGYLQGNANVDGLLLLLHLDETAGAIHDTSPSHLVGASTSETYGVAGEFGTALLNGGAGRVDFGNLPMLTVTGDFTVSAWVRPTSTAGGFIISKESAPVGSGWCLWILPGGTVDFCVGNELQGTAPSDTISTAAVVPGAWTHLVVTHTSGTQTIYINGVPQAVSSGGSFALDPTTSGFPLRLGVRYSDSSYFYGATDEVAYYARRLDATEIRELYYRGATRVQLQVRACADPACGSTPFVGPDGSASTWFVAPSLAELPDVTVPGSLGAARYFQYQLELDSETTEQPRLRSVRVGPDHVYAGTAVVTNTPATGFAYSTLLGFTETDGADHTGTVTYQLSNDGVHWYWFTGGRWQLAMDASTASPAADISAGCPRFATDVGTGVLMWRAYLSSPLGRAVVDVERIAFDYRS